MSTPPTVDREHKGLTASVLRDASLPDCSLNGVSARFCRVVVTNVRCSKHSTERERDAVKRGRAELPRIFGPDDATAEVELVVRHLAGDLYVHAEPLEGAGRWAMFGGAYITTSDSRFDEILRAIYGDGRRQVGPIPLHDRFES